MLVLRSLLIIVAALLAITSFDWLSSPTVPCTQVQQYNDAKQAEKGAKESCSAGKIVAFWRAVAYFIDNWHDAILAAATVIIAIFTATIYVANESQLRHAREVERSYLWPGFGKHEPMDDGRMKWFVTITNTGRIAGVLQVIYYAVITDEQYEVGGYKFKTFTDREDVIAPGTLNPGQPTGLDFVIEQPMVCCGWIQFEDIFGRNRKQGWKHRLRLTIDAAGCWSIPFPECYSASYHPWEGAEIENKTKQQPPRTPAPGT